MVCHQLTINGAGGIRTPGTFRYNGFQDRRLKPLGHCSFVFCILYYQQGRYCKKIRGKCPKIESREEGDVSETGKTHFYNDPNSQDTSECKSSNEGDDMAGFELWIWLHWLWRTEVEEHWSAKWKGWFPQGKDRYRKKPSAMVGDSTSTERNPNSLQSLIQRRYIQLLLNGKNNCRWSLWR